jgi:hypothetical protein
MLEEMYKDVQELMENGFDIEALRNKTTYLLDAHNKMWVFTRSYNNPVGVETFIFRQN